MLLLPLLVCLASASLSGALAGEPPPVSADSESLLLSVSDLPTPAATPGTTLPPAAAGDTTLPPTAAPEEAAETGGRESGSNALPVSPVTSQPPADRDEATTGAASGDDIATTAVPEEAASPTTTTTTTTEDLKAASTTAAADGRPTTVAADEPSDDGAVGAPTIPDHPETTPAPPGDVQTTTPGGQQTKPTTAAAAAAAAVTTPAGDSETDATTAPVVTATTPAGDFEDSDAINAVGTTPAGDSEMTTAAGTTPAGDSEVTTAAELPVRLVSGVALRPAVTLSRHRADPGLAPSETKQSKARTGVPDPEMLDNPSKPRKGAPPSGWTPATPLPAIAGGFSVTEGSPVVGDVPVTQAAPSTGAGFFGEDTLGAGLSTTEKVGGQPLPLEDAGAEPAARPKKPESAKDEAEGGAGSGVRGSAVAGVVVLLVVFLVIGFFMFRKLRETWYRRHYRKMDFLVDGMYNL